ncbi:CBF/Mak21 family-domain-containing protein [Scheffersomyces coipomensis]|uniref:CBF/Mak21 family-domain-containing protein n=1 Tax=Scheffersomyces coipomensis TaxID=1788519 RepID=UPI00315CC3CC
MAKRKNSSKEIEKRKKLKQEEQDKLLSTGLFNQKQQIDQDNDEDDEEEQEQEQVNDNDWENEEQDYELTPRNVPKTVVEGLPIKTSDGKIERVVREIVKEEEPLEEEPVEEPPIEEEPVEEEDEDSHLSPLERLNKIKEEIAELASKLMEDPEENISCLTRLRKMSESKNIITCQLSIMALIPVFKSLAPSYRIRPLTDTEKREKVGRDIIRLRNFEQGLLSNYIQYITHLSNLARTSYSNSINNSKTTSHQVKLGSIATKAACELCLSSLRYFNNRAELFAIIIKRLNRKPSHEDDLKIFTKCLRVLETLLKDDEENGDISFDITRILIKSIKDKKFRIDESVLNIFLSLKILEDFNPFDTNDRPQKPKLKKKDRVHISKKERKARKERKEIEEELQKAQHAITVEEREKFQAQILKSLLTLYLEILKSGSSSTPNDATLLTASVLEGLSRFGQMANFDLLGDFLEVLREIMNDIIEDHNEEGGQYDGKQLRTILLCIVTSFSLVLNHQSNGRLPMAIDLSKFVSNLYLILADLSLDCDLEFSHKSLRLLDPLSISEQQEKPSVNVSTKSELLLRCLDFIFFRSKNGSPFRANSFIKRLYMLLLQSPEKTSMASLKFVGKLLSRYDESLKYLWNTDEIISEGTYILGIEQQDLEVELERCNSGAATLWENVLLDKHYCPVIRDGSRSLLKNSKPNDKR